MNILLDISDEGGWSNPSQFEIREAVIGDENFAVIDGDDTHRIHLEDFVDVPGDLSFQVTYYGTPETGAKILWGTVTREEYYRIVMIMVQELQDRALGVGSL